MSVSETKRGVQLEEATVKQITGNDTINARAPFGRPFSYRPQFTLWLSTNHKPEIPDGSEAIWDRLRLIPFTQRFDGKNADPKLPEKLREELAGVLLWAVRGCVEWHEHGLGTAAAVDAATAKYREETDVVDRFFASECVFGPDEWVTKGDLFAAWESWCFDEGEERGKPNGFSRVMKERGKVKNFEEERTKKARVWRGISVISENASPPKSPAKHGGKVDSVTHSTEFTKGFSGTPSRREHLAKSENSVIASPAPVSHEDYETFSFGEGE